MSRFFATITAMNLVPKKVPTGAAVVIFIEPNEDFVSCLQTLPIPYLAFSAPLYCVNLNTHHQAANNAIVAGFVIHS